MSSEDEKYSDVSESEDSDLDMYEDYDKTINPKNLVNADELNDDNFGVKLQTKEDAEDMDLFEVVEKEGKWEWAACKPYEGALVAPTNEPKNNSEEPDEDLELDWVHGYRAYDSRTNLAYNSKGEVVYPVASLCVIYDPKTKKQRYFHGHNDDVICLAQHPTDPDIVATGQVATIVNKRACLPHICVWNTVTNECWTLKNAGKRAIRTVAFSGDGKYLASIDDSNEHNVQIWDWQKNKKIVDQKGDTNKIFHMRWNHRDPYEFVTAGKRHVYFWNFDPKKKTLKKKRGILGKFKNVTFATIAFSDKGYACLGTQTGQVYVFVNGKAKKSFKLHKGTIYTIEYIPGGIVTGGKDDKVVVLDKNVKPVNTLQFSDQIRSVKYLDNNLLVGCADSKIYQIKNPQTAKSIGEPIVSGHFDGEVWGIAPAPDSRTYATCGEDNLVAVWDIKKHIAVRKGVLSTKKGKALKVRKAASTTKHPPNQCGRAMTYSPDGKEIAIGTNDGHLIVLDAKTLKTLHDVDLNKYGKRNVTNQSENWIQAIQYSPDGQTLAVGTHGIVICLCSRRNGYKCDGKLTAHNSAITHLDWSKDGRYIRSNCLGYELLFHDINPTDLSKSGQNPYGASKLKDADWHTHSCILQWPTIGVFDPDQDGTDINTVDVNPDKTLVACGDDYGYVNLFRYPCNKQGNDRRVKQGHAAHVMKVAFTPDGKYLISAGGNDKAVMQWRVTK